MSHRKPFVAIVVASVASVAFGSFVFVGRARAAAPTTCTSDAECSKGFTCQPWAVSGGTAPACPADAPNCAVTNTPGVDTGGAGGGSGSSPPSGAGGALGSDVGAGNASGTTPTTTVISRCEPGPCQTDSDCGPDMVCHSESYSECSGGGSVAPCEPGTKCEAKPVMTEVTCTTKTRSFCAFHWQLPCNAAADCGAGFTCQPLITTSCSGGTPVSGGSGTGVGGTPGGSTSDPTLPPDNCTTTTTFPGSCQPVATICNVDADCPANWLCQDVVTPPKRGGATGVGGESGSGDDASGTGAGAATGSGAEPGGNTASGRMCSSPFIPPMASDSGEGGRTGGGEGTGTPTSGSTPPGSSGTGGTTAGPGKDDPGAGAANGAAHVADASGASNGTGGCSISGSAAGSRVAGGLSMLALLGLGVVARRRRR